MNKRFLLTAAAGLIASQPVVTAASAVEARLDSALDSARAQHQEELATAQAEAELAWTVNDGVTVAAEEQTFYGMY
jgi:hypothetical protein